MKQHEGTWMVIRIFVIRLDHSSKEEGTEGRDREEEVVAKQFENIVIFERMTKRNNEKEVKKERGDLKEEDWMEKERKSENARARENGSGHER